MSEASVVCEERHKGVADHLCYAVKPIEGKWRRLAAGFCRLPCLFAA